MVFIKTLLPQLYQNPLKKIGPLFGIDNTDTASLAHSIATEQLIICSDGSVVERAGCHGCVFAHTKEDILLTVAGPDDGHPNLITSYQSELGGLIVALYIIIRICQYNEILDGKATIYSDNKGALLHVFHNDKLGITSYTETGYDLVKVEKIWCHCFLLALCMIRSKGIPATKVYHIN
jgi:hypothetical protein